ncbi:MAG: ABC transporter ATP-binding protein/permease [Alphaproteobacteria bacterium]|nr:MAG: ABC transporter ATP-binding protein/permease [Alphaproteobacteria bacterium]
MAGPRGAWVLTVSLLILIALQIFVQYRINVWNRSIFDALQARDSGAVLFQALMFPLLAAASVVLAVGAVFARMTTQRRWRAWLSGHVVDRWLANGRYYQLNLVPGDHQNPEGRIAEDLRIATDAPVDFCAGVLQAVLSALTFIAVLWSIGGPLSFRVGETWIVIPGFLVIAAVAYSLIASALMVGIGRGFVAASERKNQAEAEYRYVLTRLHENGESIALLGGEQEERAGLDRSLRQVLRRWRQLCSQHMRTTSVSQASVLVAPVIPVILSSPKFLDGTMTLGEVMQAASAFVFVQAAFSWLVDNYPRLADWAASAQRVASLLYSLDSLQEAEQGEGFGRIQRGEMQGAALRLHDLSVTLDDGTVVVNEADVVIAPGEKVLVVGESGTGKSTLVRAIAGLWPWGQGEVRVNSGSKLFLMPQRPYVPIGTLRRATTYPAPADEIPKEQVAEALELVGLGHLTDRIDEEAPWDQILSGGEKQRLAFARLLIVRPDIIVLDEATSALDPPSQEQLMRMISDQLPATTILSVGHRPELEAFHERKLMLERRSGGARLVRDLALASRRSRRARPRWRWPIRMGRNGKRRQAAE